MTTIEIKLSRIYEAAHVDLPEQAREFAHQSEQLAAASKVAQHEASKFEDDPIGDDLRQLGDDLADHLALVVRTLNDSAMALDRIGHDFATVDSDARDWMTTHAQWVHDHAWLGKGPDLPRVPPQAQGSGER